MKTESEKLLNSLITKMAEYNANELAEASGVGVITIRHIMSCKRVPSINTLAAIERAMLSITTQTSGASRFSKCCRDNDAAERDVRKVMTQQALRRSQAGLPAYSEPDAIIEAIGLVKTITGALR